MKKYREWVLVQLDNAILATNKAVRDEKYWKHVLQEADKGIVIDSFQTSTGEWCGKKVSECRSST